MCRSDGLTPKAEEAVGNLLVDLMAGLGRLYGCSPDDIQVGPVDIGPVIGDES